MSVPFFIVSVLGLVSAVMWLLCVIDLRQASAEIRERRAEMKSMQERLDALQMCSSGMTHKYTQAMRFMENFRKYAVYDQITRLYTVKEIELNMPMPKES